MHTSAICADFFLISVQHKTANNKKNCAETLKMEIKLALKMNGTYRLDIHTYVRKEIIVICEPKCSVHHILINRNAVQQCCATVYNCAAHK